MISFLRTSNEKFVELTKRFNLAERAIFPLSANPIFYKRICTLDLVFNDESEVGFIYTVKNNIFQNQGFQYEVAIYIYGEYRRQGFGKSALLNFLSQNSSCFICVSKKNTQMMNMIYQYKYFNMIEENGDSIFYILKKKNKQI